MFKTSFKKVPDTDISDTREWIRAFSTSNLKIGYAVREIHTDTLSVSDKEGKGMIFQSKIALSLYTFVYIQY